MCCQYIEKKLPTPLPEVVAAVFLEVGLQEVIAEEEGYPNENPHQDLKGTSLDIVIMMKRASKVMMKLPITTAMKNLKTMMLNLMMI